jgi:hypothetical protein
VRYKSLSICPCCGSKLEETLSNGCIQCGASPIGPPLARPDQELPSYGYSALAGGFGALFLLSFLLSTVFALNDRVWIFNMGIWDLVAAAQTAAWRLKWISIPLSILSIWIGIRSCSLIRRAPHRFIGRRASYAGLSSSVLASLLVITFIGITVPDRLRQRRLGIEAAENAIYYSAIRVLHQYHSHYGTYPADINDLKRLPDNDGSIIAVIDLLAKTSYTPTSIQASSRPIKRGRTLRTARITPIASRLPVAPTANTDAIDNEPLTFTNYELIWPGSDKLLGTDDDRMIRDGLILDKTIGEKGTVKK